MIIYGCKKQKIQKGSHSGGAGAVRRLRGRSRPSETNSRGRLSLHNKVSKHISHKNFRKFKGDPPSFAPQNPPSSRRKAFPKCTLFCFISHICGKIPRVPPTSLTHTLSCTRLQRRCRGRSRIRAFSSPRAFPFYAPASPKAPHSSANRERWHFSLGCTNKSA